MQQTDILCVLQILLVMRPKIALCRGEKVQLIRNRVFVRLG